MRKSFGLCFAFVSLVACGTDGAGTGDDDGSGSGSGSGMIDPPDRGFQLVSADIVIEPGQEITYCWYFRTPNTEPMAIKKWQSAMTPGSHHMIMFTTASDLMPPGTVSAQNCGFGGSSSLNARPVWTYAAQTPESTVELPVDDGEGKPLAQVIQPNTPGFFQMHYLNATDEPLTVHVTLNAEALAADAAYTSTAAYITYNAGLSIKPTATNGGVPSVENGGIATKTCNTPANTKFWMVSTHAHKQAVKTEIKNGMPASSAVAFESEDWEHPAAETWMAAPFYTFNDPSGPNRLTYTCTYVNNTNRTITSGDSAQTDEMCMATGYMFPAAQPTFCICAAQGCFNL
jgi:hypothetical protein